MNDANTDYAVFLGGARLGATDSIEIARGPAEHALRERGGRRRRLDPGPEGLGGPVGGCRGRGGKLRHGRRDASTPRAPGTSWAWSLLGLGLAHGQRPRPTTRSTAATSCCAIDRDLPGGADVGATLRGFEGRYGGPGRHLHERSLCPRDREQLAGHGLRGPKAVARTGPRTSRSGARTGATWPSTSLPGVFADTTVVQNRRGVLDAQASYSGLAGTAPDGGRRRPRPRRRGTTATATSTSGRPSSPRLPRTSGIPSGPVYLTGGLRYDDFDTFGSSVTGRATAAWLLADRSLKLRASYGTGFNAPSFLELYGVATGYVGNPDLRPERTRGRRRGDRLVPPEARRHAQRDLVSQRLPRPDRVQLQRLSRNHRQRGPGPHRTASSSRPSSAWSRASSCTPPTPTSRPTTSRTGRGSCGARATAAARTCGGTSGGGGARGRASRRSGTREDVDAQTFLTVDDPDYAVARIYAEWRASRRLTLKARVENLLDRQYQPVNGYPALGLRRLRRGGVEALNRAGFDGARAAGLGFGHAPPPRPGPGPPLPRPRRVGRRAQPPSPAAARATADYVPAEMSGDDAPAVERAARARRALRRRPGRAPAVLQRRWVGAPDPAPAGILRRVEQAPRRDGVRQPRHRGQGGLAPPEAAARLRPEAPRPRGVQAEGDGAADPVRRGHRRRSRSPAGSWSPSTRRRRPRPSTASPKEADGRSRTRCRRA